VRPTKLFRTSSFRLTLIFAGLFATLVLILFGVIYWLAADYASEDEKTEIGIEFSAIEDEAKLAGYDHLPQIIADHLRERNDIRAVYLLSDRNGRKIAGNAPEMAPRVGDMKLDLKLDGKKRNIRAQGFYLANGDYLLLGQDAYSFHEMKELIARAFGVGAAATLFAAVLGGILMSRGVLGRIEMVSRTSRAIIAGDLSRRVPLGGTDDEFDDLAASVNAMLDRIQDLMERMQQVSSDIAHDLRTPLTRLRQRLERARRHAGDDAAFHRVLDSSIADVDAILETFGALLRIAQIEAGGKAAPLGEVDLSALVADLVEDFRPGAEDRAQTFDAEIAPTVAILGDRELLTQMLVNLLDNAVRHAPPGAHIRVTLDRASGFATLVVADDGPGIPIGEREKVFRPFYRLESSRTTQGSGLGLSLVAAIVKQHGAKIGLDDNEPGLRVTVAFPPYQAAGFVPPISLPDLRKAS